MSSQTQTHYSHHQHDDHHHQNRHRSMNHHHQVANLTVVATTLLALGLVVALVVLIPPQPIECSIGYFEHYGWPTYGIVKPFWMTPFSAFPSRAISGYSRKHAMHNGRGLLRFKDY